MKAIKLGKIITGPGAEKQEEPRMGPGTHQHCETGEQRDRDGTSTGERTSRLLRRLGSQVRRAEDDPRSPHEC